MITTRYYHHGEKVTLYHYKKNKHFKGVLYITRGSKLFNPWGLNVVFLGLAAIGFLSVFFPPVYSEAAQRISMFVKKPQVIPVLADLPISEEFYLEIPKINLTSTIVPNVDPVNEDEYLEKLKIGIAHAKGSYFPGDQGPIVLFSHSTDTLAHIVQYNAAFYALKDLEVGDQITVHFKGKTYLYNVSEKKIIDPQNLDVIRQTNSKLVLTTCYPPGTDWQRLIVFAK